MSNIKKPKPKVKYVLVDKPDQKALDQVFDFLFNKFLEDKNIKQ
jgi:hypothetical protein